MKRLFSLLLIFLPVAGCSQLNSRETQDIDWIWQKEAISMNLTASEQLNTVEEQSYSLMLCVYQLSDIATVQQLQKSLTGLNTLLSCQHFDDSVISSERINIQPNAAYSKLFDRYEGSRFVAIVAGYWHMSPRDSILIYSIPSKHSLWSGPSPDKLTMDVYLDKQSATKIQKAK